MISDTVSHYRILEKLGAGGMGEVYLAEDTNLDRQVAIKVLPDVFADDAERLARFEREAKLLASLNHPNIAVIHGFEEADGKRFLVLELVEGETLAERIKKGPLPIDEALEVCRQIAEGLESAHEKGVIHRDLKPANVKITPEGKVKVLDFGLAKAFHEEPAAADLSHSPTITDVMTQNGVILGTAAYMSPEQARGKSIDKRTDIWAFGCCLYEALSGKTAFLEETISDSIAAVLGKEPDWGALPASLSVEIRRLLRRCLDKNAHQRLRDIGEARVAIDNAPMIGVDDPLRALPAKQVRWGRTLTFSLGTAAITGIVVALTMWLSMRPMPPRVTRLSINPTAEAPLSGTALAISPDGTRIVYPSANGAQLSVRAIDELEPNNIVGLGSTRHPFISPDGQWIGFFDGVNALKKVAMTGGAAVTVCSLGGAAPRGGSWSPNGTIIYATDDPATGLRLVPDIGGEPELLTTPEQGQGNHSWPRFLPGGRAVLVTVGSRGAAENQVAVLDLESGVFKPLLPGRNAQYVPTTGHLVYRISGTLRAVVFDLERLEVIGASVPVLEGVASSGGAFSVAADGTLVYVPGGIQRASRRLVWVDRQGNEELLPIPPGLYAIPRLSPDGTKVALDNRESRANIWIWDLERQTMARLTFGLAGYPLWTPDGKRVVFTSFDARVGNLSWRATDGSTPLERISEGSNSRYATAITADGTHLIFREEAGQSGLDIAMLTLDGDLRSETLIKTQYNELNAELSPDGRWLAYKSNELGQDEVYVRPFPNVDAGLWQISIDGGMQPAWARSGRELFYREPDGALMRVPVELQPRFTAGTPTKVLEGLYYRGGPGRAYDVSPDGERFLMIKESDPSGDAISPPSIVVVQNWFEELKRLVPIGN